MYLSDITELTAYLSRVEMQAEEVLCIMVADKSSDHIKEIIEQLNSKQIPFFGGIFPALLFGTQKLDRGFIVEKLPAVFYGLALPHLFRVKLNDQPSKDYTAIVIADGLTSRMKELVDTIQAKLGNDVTYVGGGAGYYNLQHYPCVFDNKGIYKDAAYVCLIKSESVLAVEHGWLPLEGPFYVKKSIDNQLIELDNYNAFDVYKDILEEADNIIVSKEEFFKAAKDHPFGILQNDGSFIVRDPIAVDGGKIICVADIPEGSDVYVLKGDKQTLLESSLRIAKYCSDNQRNKYLPLLFDCISREMFLDQSFGDELKNIQSKLNGILEGALSIGEYSTHQNGNLVVHNKSTIIALVEM